MRRRGAAHAFDHFFAKLHHRRKGFRVAAEDIAEIGVEKVSCSRKTGINRGTKSMFAGKTGYRRKWKTHHQEPGGGYRDGGHQHRANM